MHSTRLRQRPNSLRFLRDGQLHRANSGSASYRLTFKVVTGPYTGRTIWHDCWLTDKALPMSKRDLAKVGITSAAQMEMPMPQKFRCKVHLALLRDDDGKERNRVKKFEVVAVEDATLEDADFPYVKAVEKGSEGAPEL
jgi:hypothetical protein